MAAGPFLIFSNALELIHEGSIDLDEDSFRMVLLTEAYTPSIDSHDTWSDASANEVANGNGYSTHGKALTVTVSRVGDTVTVDCDDQSWTSATITAKYAAIVRDADDNGALAGGDFLVAICDLEADLSPPESVSTTNGTFAVAINASGLWTSARAA